MTDPDFVSSVHNVPAIRFGFLRRILASADAEAEMVARDPVLMRALAREREIGHSIVSVSRQLAVVVIACLLPFMNFGLDMLYYDALLLLFWGSGVLQTRFRSIGRTWVSVGLILFDIVLITVIALVPNPFEAEMMPAALGYRWNVFNHFFLLLAFAVLCYSWRTVWSLGLAVSAIWLVATALVAIFGHEIPMLTAAAKETARLVGRADLQAFLDLNGVQWSQRFQEIVIFIIVAAALTLKGWRSNQLLFHQARAAAERSNLSRYFSPTIVERLASQPEALTQPASHEIAVLFADLVGFTELTERMPEGEVLALLRRYYAAIECVVFEHGGTLDKFLGDGVMATFGTPLPGQVDAANAIRAARAIVTAIDEMGEGLHVVVGAHFGRAIVGNVGPDRRLEFAVLGDTVNVASRLETVTRDLSARIVLSDTLVDKALAQGLPQDALAGFVPFPGLMLRGRHASVDVWCLRS